MGKVQAKARLGSTSNKKRDAPPHAPKHDPLDHHLRNQRGGGAPKHSPQRTIPYPLQENFSPSRGIPRDPRRNLISSKYSEKIIFINKFSL